MLGALEKKTVKGRRLVVKRFSTVADLQPCQILFVSRSEKDRISEVVAATNGSSTLLVSEVDGFAQRWGIINFVSEGNKVRVEINSDAAKRAGLKISGKLLRVAKIVEDQRS